MIIAPYKYSYLLTYLLTYLRTRAILALPAQSRAVLPRHDELSHSALSVTWQLSVRLSQEQAEKRETHEHKSTVSQTEKCMWSRRSSSLLASPHERGYLRGGDVFMG